LNRRGAVTQSFILLTAPAALLTILCFSLRLCGENLLTLFLNVSSWPRAVF